MIALVEPQSTKWRLRRGLSAEEVADLFDELGAPLLSWFRREVKTRDEAADLWSETWPEWSPPAPRSAARTAPSTPPSSTRPRAHLLADWRRRGVIEQRALQQLGIEPLWMDDELPELDNPVALQHLEGLPADQREAVRLRVLEELDYDEIATRTGSTEPAVRQRVSRGARSGRATRAASRARATPRR